MFLNRGKQKINIVGGLILVALTLAAGISVYVVMQRQAESMLRKSLAATLQGNVGLFKSQIDQALTSTRTVTTRLHPVQSLQLLETGPNNAEVRAELQQIAQSFLQTGFTGFSLYDARDRELARAGIFSQKHDLRVPLKVKNRAFLLWDKQFILYASMDVLDPQGRRIGSVTTEANLPQLTEVFSDIASIGQTGEFAVCAPLADDERKMDCFLSRISGKEFKSLPREIEGKSLPMDHPLNGETGIIFAKDYRRTQVAAAYAPVGSLGLGMVIKIERDELYQPVAEQLKFVVPLLVALVLAGMLLLHILVSPLVRKLIDYEEKLRSIYEGSNDAIMLLTDKGFIDCNAQALEMLGLTDKSELVAHFLAEFSPPVQPDGRESMVAAADNIAEAQQLGGNHFEWILRRKNGEDFPADVLLSAFNYGGERILQAAVRDITERKQAEQRIAHLANHDALTDLPNRHLLQDRIRQALIHARRNGSQGAVLFIDLDKFKIINDSMGHDIGDLLLKEVAQRLVSSLRSQDTVARQGGDEFVVVLHSVANARDAGATTQKLLDALLLPYQLKGKELNISASIGIVVFPGDGEDADTLLKHSDTAMYQAKEAGRNNYQFFARK